MRTCSTYPPVVGDLRQAETRLEIRSDVIDRHPQRIGGGGEGNGSCHPVSPLFEKRAEWILHIDKTPQGLGAPGNYRIRPGFFEPAGRYLDGQVGGNVIRHGVGQLIAGRTVGRSDLSHGHS